MSYNLKGSKVISLHNELQNAFINTMGIIQFFQTQTKITIGYIISVTAFLF